MDVVRDFILERGGQGEFSFDDLKKYASCVFDRDLTDEDVIRMLMGFRKPGIRIEVNVGKRVFLVDIDNPDELLLSILKEYKGRRLREALEAFEDVFGSFDEKRLLRMMRIFGNKIVLEKGGVRRPIGMITNLKERMDAKIVFQ